MFFGIVSGKGVRRYDVDIHLGVQHRDQTGASNLLLPVADLMHPIRIQHSR
jgi:hypothetical protein